MVTLMLTHSLIYVFLSCLETCYKFILFLLPLTNWCFYSLTGLHILILPWYMLEMCLTPTATDLCFHSLAPLAFKLQQIYSNPRLLRFNKIPDCILILLIRYLIQKFWRKYISLPHISRYTAQLVSDSIIHRQNYCVPKSSGTLIPATHLLTLSSMLSQ